MKKVTNNTIIMTRGDTCRIKLILTNSDGNEFVPKEGDVIRFAAKKKYSDVEALIYIVVPNDTLILEIKPEDTKNLDFGTYVYDLQITFEDGTVDTFISKAILKLEEEVD